MRSGGWRPKPTRRREPARGRGGGAGGRPTALPRTPCSNPPGPEHSRDRTAADPPGSRGRGQRRPVPVRRRDQGAGRAGHLGGLAACPRAASRRGRRPGPSLRHPRRADRGRQRRGAAPPRRGHAAAHRRHHGGGRGTRAWRTGRCCTAGPPSATPTPPTRCSARCGPRPWPRAGRTPWSRPSGCWPPARSASPRPTSTPSWCRWPRALGPGAPLYVVETRPAAPPGTRRRAGAG